MTNPPTAGATPPAAAGLLTWWRHRLRMSRWLLRLRFAATRLLKALRVLEVRVWRKWLVRLYWSRTDRAPPPAMVTLRLTSHCNLRCVQCGQWGEQGVYTRPERGVFPRELTTEEWKAFIARLAPVCPHLYFFGGEPFLRKDCLELIRFAGRRGMTTGVNTNATYLAGRGHDLVASGLDYLIVSLDGPRQVNNAIRLGKSDVYETVVAAVEELVRARRERHSPYPLIELFMTLTEANQEHIAETAKLAMQLGVDYFAVQFGIFTTPELARVSAQQFQEEFGVAPHFFQGFVRDVSRMDPERIAEQLREVKRLWGSRYKQYPPGEFDVADYYRKPEQPLRRKPCLVPWIIFQVMPNGDLVWCDDFPDLVAGNVREQDPLALWNGPVSRAYRRRIRTKGIFPAETRCCDYYLQ